MYKNKRIFLSLILASLTLLLGGTLSARGVIPNDPEVKTGTLDNGLKYYVRHNNYPENKAVLKLVVLTGSLVEDEDQRGLAHFTEHMLFNGTKAYPGNKVVGLLESFGMEVGADVNASTGLDRTIYGVNVNLEDESQLPTGLNILEQWAFNAVLSSEEFEKERPVILEEWRQNRSVYVRLRDKLLPIVYKGSRYSDRLPIGKVDIIEHAPVEALRRYYRDWYRPNLMAIVAVGDFQAEDVVKRIKERFGKYKNPEALREVPTFPIPRHEDTRVAVLSDSETTKRNIRINVKMPETMFQTLPDFKEKLVRSLYYSMLNDRFQRIFRRADSPMTEVDANQYKASPETHIAELYGTAYEGRILDGIQALLTEVRRVKLYGFTEPELSRAKVNALNAYEQKELQRKTSAAFAEYYISAYKENNRYPSTKWTWEEAKRVFSSITLKDLSRYNPPLLDEPNRFVAVTGPDSPDIREITEPQVLNAMAKSLTAKLKPWKGQSVESTLVKNPPVPGEITSKTTVPGTDVVSLSLPNGAVVLYKSVDSSDDISFTAVRRGGKSLIAEKNLVSAALSSTLVKESGLGDFPAEDLEDALAGKDVSIQPSINSYTSELNGVSTPEDLETLFQMIYLTQNSPREDKETFDKIIREQKNALKDRDTIPRVLYQDKVNAAIWNNNPRMAPLTAERLSEADFETAVNIYKEQFYGAGKFTYIFTGDIKPETFEPLVKQWIGGQPEGTSRAEWKDVGLNVSEKQQTVSVKAGKEPKSLVSQIWTGKWSGSLSEETQLNALSSALGALFFKRIREEAGGVYSINVYASIIRGPRESYVFIVQYSCDPTRVEEITTLVKQEIDSWRNTPPDELYAHDVVATLNNRLPDNMETSGWWATQIKNSVFLNREMAQVLDPSLIKERYDTITPKSLSRMAQYLDDSRYIEGVIYPKDMEKEK